MDVSRKEDGTGGGRSFVCLGRSWVSGGGTERVPAADVHAERAQCMAPARPLSCLRDRKAPKGAVHIFFFFA